MVRWPFFCPISESLSDLILWFPFEGSGHPATDVTGNRNDATTAEVERVDGKQGKGISIGKKGEYVETCNVLRPDGTVEFWFKPNGDGDEAQTCRLSDAADSLIFLFIGKVSRESA